MPGPQRPAAHGDTYRVTDALSGSVPHQYIHKFQDY